MKIYNFYSLNIFRKVVDKELPLRQSTWFCSWPMVSRSFSIHKKSEILEFFFFLFHWSEPSVLLKFDVEYYAYSLWRINEKVLQLCCSRKFLDARNTNCINQSPSHYFDIDIFKKKIHYYCYLIINKC